ncbi:MAG: hypothetical protein KKC55_15580, partial [Gammaproteobacteria bacterium]|nr:hypothetical protein [Gammaproteobacteria bacterium]
MVAIANPALRTVFEYEAMRKLDRLMKFAFSPVFGRAFRPMFDAGEAEAAETHWWLAPVGGVDTILAAYCIAAYDAKNAASLVASYDNLAAPLNGLPDGTYDCTPIVVPDWANGSGWMFTILT